MVCLSESHWGLNFRDVFNARRYCNKDLTNRSCNWTKPILKACLYLFALPWQWHMRQLNCKKNPEDCVVNLLVTIFGDPGSRVLEEKVNKTQMLKTLLSHLKNNVWLTNTHQHTCHLLSCYTLCHICTLRHPWASIFPWDMYHQDHSPCNMVPNLKRITVINLKIRSQFFHLKSAAWDVDII